MLYAPDEKGQGLVEYALIICLIAIVIVIALTWMTGALSTIYSRIYNGIKDL